MKNQKFSFGKWGSMLILFLFIVLSIPLLGCNRIAKRVDATPIAYPELGFTVLDNNAKDLDWFHEADLIAYPRRDPLDWYYDVWVIRPDGTDKHCITCSQNFPQKHNGNVTWHPSG